MCWVKLTLIAAASAHCRHIKQPYLLLPTAGAPIPELAIMNQAQDSR